MASCGVTSVNCEEKRKNISGLFRSDHIERATNAQRFSAELCLLLQSTNSTRRRDPIFGSFKRLQTEPNDETRRSRVCREGQKSKSELKRIEILLNLCRHGKGCNLAVKKKKMDEIREIDTCLARLVFPCIRLSRACFSSSLSSSSPRGNNDTRRNETRRDETKQHWREHETLDTKPSGTKAGAR